MTELTVSVLPGLAAQVWLMPRFKGREPPIVVVPAAVVMPPLSSRDMLPVSTVYPPTVKPRPPAVILAPSVTVAPVPPNEATAPLAQPWRVLLLLAQLGGVPHVPSVPWLVPSAGTPAAMAASPSQDKIVAARAGATSTATAAAMTAHRPARAIRSRA